MANQVGLSIPDTLMADLLLLPNISSRAGLTNWKQSILYCPFDKNKKAFTKYLDNYPNPTYSDNDYNYKDDD